MSSHGPLIPALSLATGIAASSITGASWWTGFVPVAAACLVYAAILASSGDPVAAFRLNKWHALWIFLLFLGIGMADEGMHRPSTLEESYGKTLPAEIRCEVASVLPRTYGDRLEVIIDGTNGAKARIYSGATEIEPGDFIMAPASGFKEIASDTSAIARRIAPMLKSNGILYSARIEPEYLRKDGRSMSPRYFFADLRESIEIKIEKSGLRRSTAQFVNAILLGDKTGLDEETRMSFAHGGTAHMLALSGLHLAIIAGFLMLLMTPAKLAGKYKWGYAAAIILLWGYVLVTGVANSTVRACIMLTLAFTGVIIERKNIPANSLWSACLIILVADPSALFDAGFQLSATCVAALIYFSPHLNPIHRRHHPRLYRICEALLTTMIATAASWALTSYYFGQIPLMFLPTNVLLLPLLPAILSGALVFTAALCAGLEPAWMGKALDFSYDFLLDATGILSSGSDFVVEWQIPVWSMAVWFALLAAAAWRLNRIKT